MKNTQSSLVLAFATLLMLVFASTTAQGQKVRQLKSNGKAFKHIERPKAESRNLSCGPLEFRKIDGTCNNVSTPERKEWGAADNQLQRVTPTAYGASDEYNAMAGQNRLSARAISNLTAAQSGDRPSEEGLSAFVFTWGQFLDHDIDLTPEGETEYVPISLPLDEPLFTYDIPFMRSELHQGTGDDEAREHTNLITSWIDASNVYGSEVSRADWLRTKQFGMLKTSEGELLPFNTVDGEYSSAIDPDAPSMAGDEDGTIKTYVAGDVRAAEQPGLTALHTLFVREHNRICQQLRQEGMRNDEQMYQTARKRVGALMQAITYQEFLPALGIRLAPYDGYDPSLKPDISNVFATAAYRLGHTMVTEELLLRSNFCGPVGEGSLSLVDGFFNPDVLREYNIDPILKGLSMQTQQEIDPFIIDNLRNFLFATPGRPGTFGLDLASLNIQRGRDHGLPDYNTIREQFLGNAAQGFEDITSNRAHRNALREAYGNNINTIDAWVGMLSEDHMQGSSVGPTLHAILKWQFEQLRDGDSFYYEFDYHLDNRVRREISNTRLSDVIERNTDVAGLSNNVFEARPCGFGGGGGPGGGGGGNNGGGGRPGGGRDNVQNNSNLGNSVAIQPGVLYAAPNPTPGKLIIRLAEEQLEQLQLQVADVSGSILIQQSYTKIGGYFEEELDLAKLPAGVYFVNLKTDVDTYTQRIVLSNGK